MKTSNLCMTLFAALAITACSEENEFPQESAKDPKADRPDAYTSIAINIPHTTMTKAPSGRAIDSGTADENKVRTLHVFIYDTDPPHTPTVAEFTVEDNSLTPQSSGSSTWVTNKPIKTKKNDKYIFAAVNLNADMVNYITTNGLGAFSYNEFAQEISQLVDPTNGFVMFNTSYPESTPAANLYEDESLALTNRMSIPVSRVVAKTAVFKANDFVVNGGGKMTDIKFGWRNLNKKFYFIQDKRDGIIKDYNWENYSVSDIERGSDAINTYLSADVPASFSYAPENSFKYSLGQTEINGVTFISVSGVFTPDKVISTTNPTPTQPADFTIIDNPNNSGKTFYVVRTTDGIANYFVNGTIAQQYAELCSNNTPGMPSYNGTYALEENTFTDGICYFHIFVNANATSPQAPYNVYRNQYFKVNIHSIQAPGNPSDNFDTGEILKPETWISTDIEINPWEVYEEDYDL